jgi:hypothetical protein
MTLRADYRLTLKMKKTEVSGLGWWMFTFTAAADNLVRHPQPDARRPSAAACLKTRAAAEPSTSSANNPLHGKVKIGAGVDSA